MAGSSGQPMTISCVTNLLLIHSFLQHSFSMGNVRVRTVDLLGSGMPFEVRILDFTSLYCSA